MKKIDKETLSDLYVSMVELVGEIKSLLQLEAPPQVFDQSKIWIDQLSDALGGGGYVDVYNPSFFLTLENLGIIKMDGTTAELKDDDDDLDGLDNDDGDDDEGEDAVSAMISEGGANFSSRPVIEDGVPKVEPDGTIRWINKYGILHRTDGPAVEGREGHREWHENGQPHRVGGPAVIFPGGDTIWYFRGQYHREDGPAIDFANGNKAWYRYGLKVEPSVSNSKEANITRYPQSSAYTGYPKKNYAEGWDRTFGKPSINDRETILSKLKKENENEGEDFVEIVFPLDESKEENQGDQSQLATTDQQTNRQDVHGLVEVTSVAVIEPKVYTTIATSTTTSTTTSDTDTLKLKSYEELWDEMEKKNGMPNMCGWGEYGCWFGEE